MPLLSIYIWRTTSSFRRMWLCCYNWMTTNNEVLLTFYLYFYPCRTEGERTKMGFALNKAMRSGKSFELRYIFGKMYRLSWKKIPNFSVHFWHLPTKSTAFHEKNTKFFGTFLTLTKRPKIGHFWYVCKKFWLLKPG